MGAKILGVMGVETMDSFRHGKENMMVKVAGLFKLVDANAYEMDKDELVTILAETMIIPDYAYQTYIQWEEIDPYTIKGIINYNGLKASGIFYFNVDFEMIRFETEDRYFTDSKANYL